MEKSEAAVFLVEQMELILEENRRLVQDNLVMENKLQLMNLEYEKSKAENKILMSFFEINDQNPSSENKISEDNKQLNLNLNVKMLFLRIEELEDIIAQYKNINSPVRIVEIEESFLDLNLKIEEKETQIERLNNKIDEYLKQNNKIFDESEAINSISKALNEKDMIIISLRNQIQENNIFKINSNEIQKNYEKLSDECKKNLILNFS